MHIVPAPAESLMKSRVLSIPGLQGVMDTGFSDFPGERVSDERSEEPTEDHRPSNQHSLEASLGWFER